jgi:uncharacterized protein DUF6328
LSDNNDRLVRDYDTIIKESALLTTFSGILFAFLLNISINIPSSFSTIEVITLLISLYSITVAVALFVMPVVYHHFQYPYVDLDKFKIRSHRFILSGLIPLAITFYLGLELALHRQLGEIQSFILASIPFILVYFLFRLRKK